MSSSISDRTAIAFSTAFYVAIASERSLKNSFEQGINEIMLLGIPEGHIPRLLSRDNVDPSQIYPLASISPEVDSTASRKVIVHSKRRKPEPIQFIEGITAHLFFPVETSEENRSLDYHERHLHHRIIANHKMHPPKAYYMTPNSDGWRFIMEYPEYWVSEIVTDEGYKTNDPNFMQRWCDNYGYSLKRKVAEIKDLLESD
jgi:hypothetical protein